MARRTEQLGEREGNRVCSLSDVMVGQVGRDSVGPDASETYIGLVMRRPSANGAEKRVVEELITIIGIAGEPRRRKNFNSYFHPIDIGVALIVDKRRSSRGYIAIPD